MWKPTPIDYVSRIEYKVEKNEYQEAGITEPSWSLATIFNPYGSSFQGNRVNKNKDTRHSNKNILAPFPFIEFDLANLDSCISYLPFSDLDTIILSLRATETLVVQW